MKTKNRLLASILCVLMLTFCIIGLSSCGEGKKCSHKWGEWSVTKEATCMEAQTEERECNKCGVSESRTSGDVVDHKDDNKDHVCDYKCGKNDIEKHNDSAKDEDHECDYCGETMEECTYPEGSTICEVCGKDKNAPTTKPSNPSVSKKPNISYYKLFNSGRNATSFSVKVKNFSYVVKDPSTSELMGSFTQNGTIEMQLYNTNESIGGSATGSVEIFNGPVPNENANCEFQAIIEDNNVYVNFEVDGETAGMKLALESIANQSLATMPSESVLVADFLANTIIPTLDTFVELNSKDANDFLGDVYNMLYSFEKKSDGSYVATLDYNKLKALNEALATKPVAEVIDLYFGKDTFSGLVASAQEILALEPSEIPAYLDAHRIDSDALIEGINGLAANMGAPDGFDIEEMLDDPELDGYTIGMLLFGVEDNSYMDTFNDNIDTMREKTFYELNGAENTNELIEEFNEMMDTLAENYTVSFVVNRSGEFVSVSYKINNFTYPNDYKEETLNVEIEMIVNGTINTTWSDIVEDIEDTIVLPEENSLSHDMSYNCYENESGYVIYEDEKYYYENGIYVFVSKPLYDNVNFIIFAPEDDDWTTYTAYYSEEYYSFTLATIDVNGEEVYLIVNEYSGEAVRIEDYSDVSQDNYIDIFFETFEDPEGTTSPMTAIVNYRYNSRLDKYDFSN